MRGNHCSPWDSPTKGQYAGLWCWLCGWPKQTVEQSVEMALIWYAMKLISCHMELVTTPAFQNHRSSNSFRPNQSVVINLGPIQYKVIVSPAWEHLICPMESYAAITDAKLWNDLMVGACFHITVMRITPMLYIVNRIWNVNKVR